MPLFFLNTIQETRGGEGRIGVIFDYYLKPGRIKECDNSLFWSKRDKPETKNKSFPQTIKSKLAGLRLATPTGLLLSMSVFGITALCHQMKRAGVLSVAQYGNIYEYTVERKVSLTSLKNQNSTPGLITTSHVYTRWLAAWNYHTMAYPSVPRG